MSVQIAGRQWIFVSHASSDLDRVRKVRNYLEDRGGSPLLFHLLALTDPADFWPLIEREIRARNFFLYCDSAAATASSWVGRERETVEAVRRGAPKRVGHVSVETSEIDTAALDEFLAYTRVYPSYHHRDRQSVLPFIVALREAGFSVFDAVEDMRGDEPLHRITDEVRLASADGWVAYFVSALSLQSKWVAEEIRIARDMNARLAMVLLEPVEMAWPVGVELIRGYDNPAAAAHLVRYLLTR